MSASETPHAGRAGRGPVLVTGFGAWGAIEENPTQLIVERLAAETRPGLVALTLPVDSAALGELVEAALARHAPCLWIGLGLAVGATVVAVERTTVNLRDFVEPDIAGAQPAGVPVIPDGPAAYLSTIPVSAVVVALRTAGIPARASNTAGAFLCNQLMYTAMHAIARRGAGTAFGFLHVPAHPALVARQRGRFADHASMSLDLMTSAVEVAIDVALAGAASEPCAG